MGLKYKWSDFKLTDNSCKELSESPTVLRERFATKLLITEEQTLQEQLTAARGAAINSIISEEKEAEKSITLLEERLAKFLDSTEKAVEGAVEEVERDLKLTK